MLYIGGMDDDVVAGYEAVWLDAAADDRVLFDRDVLLWAESLLEPPPDDGPLPPDDGWFGEVEPLTPVEPEWFVVERVGLYGGGVGG